MFINFIKEISLKNILKKRITNVTPSIASNSVATVGIILDESYFGEKENLIKELVKNTILSSNIKLLVYRDKIKKNEVLSVPTFSNKEINWRGEFIESYILDFINTPFDLLISYYDIEKPFLVLATNQSRAHFKVGFSNTDKRLNHLTINTTVEEYKIFIKELFRYLKILKKL